MRFPQLGAVPAMTATERQRLFRKRHPGYYQQLHARRRAQWQAGLAHPMQAPVVVEEKVMLALPAPVVQLSIFDLIADLQRQSEARDATPVQTSEAH